MQTGHAPLPKGTVVYKRWQHGIGISQTEIRITVSIGNENMDTAYVP